MPAFRQILVKLIFWNVAKFCSHVIDILQSLIFFECISKKRKRRGATIDYIEISLAIGSIETFRSKQTIVPSGKHFP